MQSSKHPDRQMGALAVSPDRRAPRAAPPHDVRIENGHPRGRPARADDVLTVNQVAALFKLSPRTVSEYGARGVLPSVKIGRHRRFSRLQLEALMGSDKNGGK
jgi:excisionase family DNA binding protein